jgi:hypothetical protein
MLDRVKEEQWKTLKKNFQILGIPPPMELFVGLDIFDRDGAKKHSEIRRGNSWTRNYYNMAFSIMAGSGGGNSNNFGAGYMSGKRTSATIDRELVYCTYRGSVTLLAYGIANNTANSSAFGIMVGTSATAFDEDHYTMQGVITSGTGAGQLTYNAMAAPTLTYTAGTKTWTNVYVRTFTNGSGGAITVQETGIYWVGYFFYGASSYFLIERNVIDPAAAVGNGDTLRVSYTFSMDFSAID